MKAHRTPFLRGAMTLTLASLLVAVLVPAARAQHGRRREPATEGPTSAGARTIARFRYPPLEWQVPRVGREVERYVLPNGLVIYLMEDHKLPEFRIRALVRCGHVYDPPERQGISDLAGTVIRSGGTRRLPPDSLNALLEYIAASIETHVGDESGTASLYCLSKDIETGVRLFADVLRRPAFDEEKLELAKEQIRKAIKARNDNPGAVASREFDHLIYDDHPLGRILEWATVEPLGRADLEAYHRRYFVPNRILMGITGDFDAARIKKLIERRFGDWPRDDEPLPDPPAVARAYHPGVYFIDKDVNQANIRFGHLGIRQDNPDRYAISVMNFVLGGGSFNSRMTSRVRSDEGLAYSVGSRYETGTRERGEFYAYTQTKLKTARRALDLMKAEVERIRTEKVTDDELALAKDAYINRYVFRFTSADRIVGQLMRLEYDDRPRDLLEVYLDRIRAVTADDVLRVAKQYLHPERMTYLVVGQADEIRSDFEDLGPVTDLPLEEPKVD